MRSVDKFPDMKLHYPMYPMCTWFQGFGCLFHFESILVEKHATESHKEGESAIKLDLPSFVAETPFHRATTERPVGLICVEKIGLARRRLPPTALPSRSGSELIA